MQFRTADERDAYFARIGENPQSVQFGAAMEHAATTLGAWGSEDALMHDCACIMAAELRRYCIENDHRYATTFITTGTIKNHSESFRQAFRSVRIKANGEAENKLAEMIRAQSGGKYAEHWDQQHRTELTDDEAETLFNLHQKILDDFRAEDIWPVTSSDFEKAQRY